MNDDRNDSLLDRAKDAADDLKDKADDAVDSIEDKAEDAAERMSDKADTGGDDFRDALSNFSAALDRLGHATEQKARAEWAEGKPEVERAVGEMKKGLDGLIRKSTGLIDSLSGKLSKSADAGATEPEPADTPAKPDEPTS